MQSEHKTKRILCKVHKAIPLRENAKHVTASFIPQLAHEHKNLIGWDT